MCVLLFSVRNISDLQYFPFEVAHDTEGFQLNVTCVSTRNHMDQDHSIARWKAV
jgi:hypothetical protein